MPTRLYNFFLGLVSLGISREYRVAQSESIPTSQISNYYSAVNVSSLASIFPQQVRRRSTTQSRENRPLKTLSSRSSLELLLQVFI